MIDRYNIQTWLKLYSASTITEKNWKNVIPQ